MKATPARIGFLSTGLNTYWNQFEGLLDHLLGYSKTIVSHIESQGGVEVTDVGMVDCPEKAAEAATVLKRAGVDGGIINRWARLQVKSYDGTGKCPGDRKDS